MKLSDIDTTRVLLLIGSLGPGDSSVIPITRLFPGVPEKLAVKKLEKLASQGLIEYGVSVGRPWLTKEGRERAKGSGAASEG